MNDGLLALSIANFRQQEMRWRILRILNISRPIGVSESLINMVLNDQNFNAGLSELRRELDYLEKKQLVKILTYPTWIIELTATGIDVVEGNVECPAGITRPIVMF